MSLIQTQIHYHSHTDFLETVVTLGYSDRDVVMLSVTGKDDAVDHGVRTLDNSVQLTDGDYADNLYLTEKTIADEIVAKIPNLDPADRTGTTRVYAVAVPGIPEPAIITIRHTIGFDSTYGSGEMTVGEQTADTGESRYLCYDNDTDVAGAILGRLLVMLDLPTDGVWQTLEGQMPLNVYAAAEAEEDEE